MKRSRLQKRVGKRKVSRLPLIKKPIYYFEWKEKRGKSPIGFMGKLKSFPPIMKTKDAEMVIIDWKTRTIKDVWGKPIGRMPTKQRLDRFCPEKKIFEV